MKKVGIIGGLGPETTARFYIKVVEGCQNINPLLRPEVVIVSVEMKRQTERDFIINGNVGNYVNVLVEAARKLEILKVDFIVIPCNSVHIFIDDIRKSVNIPVLSIVDETKKNIKSVKKIGLISTGVTAKERLYEKVFEQKFDIVRPTQKQQDQINQIINRLVEGEKRIRDRKFMIETAGDLITKGAEVVLLACTDLQLLFTDKQPKDIIDTMNILVDSTVNLIKS